jgi:hypothetical protein
MRVAKDFFALFEDTVASAEHLLAREQSPPPPPGTGRSRNGHTIGDVDSNAVFDGRRLGRNGYTYVPAEGFASVVTISAPPAARVGEWVHLRATRSNGPWNPVRQDEVRPGEINLFEPPIFEQEVAANLSWSEEPAGIIGFNTDDSAGTPSGARSVVFGAPGTYRLQARSVFPLRVLSNTVTIKVE